MPEKEVRVGDIGTIFRLIITEDELPVDISTATGIYIVFKKPNKTIAIQEAIFTTDGSDGKIEYTTVEDDIDMAGRWEAQGVVELTTGRWGSDIHHFWVHENLADFDTVIPVIP